MNPEPIVSISALEHHLYCPRQCALIHVDGLWVDNQSTVRGTVGHERADSGAHRTERGIRVLRSIPLWSERLGLTGRADIVEVHGDGAVVPVEYKIGARHGDAAHVQLCAQALCLEEMLGLDVTTGAIWLSAPRRRLSVAFDRPLRQLTLTAIDDVRIWLRAGTLPEPVNDQRCGKCQLFDHCQPGVCSDADRVRNYMAHVLECAS